MTPNDSSVEISRVDFHPRAGINLDNILGREIALSDNSCDVSRIDNRPRAANRVQKDLMARDYQPNDESCEVSRVETGYKVEKVF